MSNEKTICEEGNYILKIIEGDITDLNVDAVVNAANTHLMLGSGVAGAIRRAGGPQIQEECNAYVAKHGIVQTGGAAITSGGNLKAKYVIHAVGPIYYEYSSEEADERLKSAVVSSLNIFTEKNLSSIALPAISAGIYGFPKDRCAEIMISTCLNYIKSMSKKEMGNNEKEANVNSDEKEANISSKEREKKEILLCLYGNQMFQLFKDTLNRIVF